ncbi:hypothetical protein PF004_g22593 [Phytophthora fragariae]|uniref:Uncharacterized protein n=1 Tax=Phytophthora fragariae TaxID=53985 RepID=A0A6G0QNA3_9STRA|nr:hypothetical protein PF004_g22593 [Phytophthora fragariae]KAE9294138.1 hypothetical protein PF008_g24626 [Phytophthora fragariae]
MRFLEFSGWGWQLRRRRRPRLWAAGIAHAAISAWTHVPLRPAAATSTARSATASEATHCLHCNAIHTGRSHHEGCPWSRDT